MKFNLRQKSLDDFNITFALKYMKYILFKKWIRRNCEGKVLVCRTF